MLKRCLLFWGNTKMAGYIFLIGATGTMKQCIEDGVYSTVISEPRGHWGIPNEATFCDFLSMKAGDNVYFFQKRKIYGVGELVNVGNDCKYKNYPQASTPKTFAYENVKINLLYDKGLESPSLRWLCTFSPSPAFFLEGIDMDDVLGSAPEQFRMLRAIQNVSFIKLDDNENKALRNHIIFRNRSALKDISAHFAHCNTTHIVIKQKISGTYQMTSKEIMDLCVDPSGVLRHEMALECGLVDALANRKPESNIFGKWDYISHQVIASPFKPLIYVDKMDIFGYRYLSDLPGGYDTLGDFLILELKRDIAERESVEQVMKYVEWVKQEYAFGDYSRIKAFVVAGSFTQPAIDAVKEIAVRYYTFGSHPAMTNKWTDLILLEYRYDIIEGVLKFKYIYTD